MTEPDFEAWFHRAPCGLLALSPEGSILEVNDTFAAWMSFAPADLVGRPFSSLLDAGSRLFYETRHAQILPLQGSVKEVALTLKTASDARLAVLINSAKDEQHGIVRCAVFDATERRQYETELLKARKSAESSETRVRILQDISSTFGLSASDEDVAESFVEVARDAFDATEAAVFLAGDGGEMQLVAGVNPLDGRVPPVRSLRHSPRVTVVTAAEALAEYPVLAQGLVETRLASVSITPLLDDGVRLGILVCFFGRRTEFDDHFYDLQKALGRQASQTLVRVRLQRRLAHMALYDQLTGIANRQLLQQTLDDAIDTAATTGSPLAVIFLDIDEFKSINDRLGHAAGDAVLAELAGRLRTGVRAGDSVGRLGGDEFVAVCADADADAASAIAERILEHARLPIEIAGAVVRASVSAGVALYRPEMDTRPTGEQMLIRADGAMYESKDAGKDRVTLG